MNLFDGLIKPGVAGEFALRRALELRRDQWSRPGYFYRGGADLLLQHGRFYAGRLLPDQYAHLTGAEGQCFSNALAAAKADPSLRYCEGYYSLGGDGDFCVHGWCVDPSNQLVELTFPTHGWHTYGQAASGLPYLPPERWSYWGVTVPVEFAEQHRDHMSYGLPMIDRPHADISTGLPDMQDNHDFPILKRPFDPMRKDIWW